MNLSTQNLILTPLSSADLCFVHSLHSIPEVDEFNTLGIPATIKETESLLQSMLYRDDSKPQCKYYWKLQMKNTGANIGLAGLSLSNDKFKLGEIFYKLHPDYWGKGYGTEITKQLISIGFDHFHLHKVEAGVSTENIASIKVLEKAGMTREGLRRKILQIRGEWKDNYHYAIVEDDPRPQ